MGLESYSQCPSCGSEIALKNARPGVFACPHCGAEFRHNYRRWAVAIPTMLVITLSLFYLAPDLGLWIFIGSVFLTSIIAGGLPEYVTQTSGRQIEPHQLGPHQRMSTFYRVAMTCFFLVAMTALGWSLVHLIKFLNR